MYGFCDTVRVLCNADFTEPYILPLSLFYSLCLWIGPPDEERDQWVDVFRWAAPPVELAMKGKVKDQCSAALAVLGHNMDVLQEGHCSRHRGAPCENQMASGIDIYDNPLATPVEHNPAEKNVAEGKPRTQLEKVHCDQ